MIFSKLEKFIYGASEHGAGNYSIPQIDLSVKPDNCPDELSYLFDYSVIDDSADYLGHPDSVLLKNGDILTVYPAGHGKGAVRGAVSRDGGLTYEDVTSFPDSFKSSRETPTIYRLDFVNGSTALLLCSGNPKWGAEPTTGGFNYSLSYDEGNTWSEFELVYSKKSDCPVDDTIVVMASLTRLKENGEYADKWMGFFHDRNFVNYKSVLSFDEEGIPHWSRPVPYFSKYRTVEKTVNMCEVEVIRSGFGRGDELCLICRSNSKKHNSLISFSTDEGETWSEPSYVPASLNGERHKADYFPDGRLFITFRSIERDFEKVNLWADRADRDWYSEGWIAWVGTYDDLKSGREGQYRIKIAHTYIDGRPIPSLSANADTAYCGNVVLEDGTVVTSSYGAFGEKKSDGGYKTYVVSKRIKLCDVEKLLAPPVSEETVEE